MKLSEVRIAIDGGAATGKTAISKLLAKKLNIEYISTGLMYRLVTKLIIENDKLDLINNKSKQKDLQEFLNNYHHKISFYKGEILLDREVIDFELLHDKSIRDKVSEISSDITIRHFCTEEQKNIAKNKGILMEGRDITSIVMPDADVKFFIEVEPEIKALRRVQQLQKNNLEASYEEMLASVIARDKSDRDRKIAPLIKTEDSIEIYNNYLPIKKIVKFMFRDIKNMAMHDFEKNQKAVDEISKFNRNLNQKLFDRSKNYSKAKESKIINAIEERNKLISLENEIKEKNSIEKNGK